MKANLKNLKKVFPDKAQKLWAVIGNKFYHLDSIMAEVDRLLGNSGVEIIRSDKWISNYFQDICLVYSNTGDTYATTIGYNLFKGQFEILSLGDFVEYYEGKGIQFE
jgi:hypothetical protein